MKFIFKDFKEDFPSEDVCLTYVFKLRYPSYKGWYRVKNRTSFANAKGQHIYPLAGTIFEKSDTPLRKWFYAIYFLTTHPKTTIQELQKKLGVTYKTAWRINKKIRTLSNRKLANLETKAQIKELLKKATKN